MSPRSKRKGELTQTQIIALDDLRAGWRLEINAQGLAKLSREHDDRRETKHISDVNADAIIRRGLLKFETFDRTLAVAVYVAREGV